MQPMSDLKYIVFLRTCRHLHSNCQPYHSSVYHWLICMLCQYGFTLSVYSLQQSCRVISLRWGPSCSYCFRGVVFPQISFISYVVMDLVRRAFVAICQLGQSLSLGYHFCWSFAILIILPVCSHSTDPLSLLVTVDTCFWCNEITQFLLLFHLYCVRISG